MPNQLWALWKISGKGNRTELIFPGTHALGRKIIMSDSCSGTPATRIDSLSFPNHKYVICSYFSAVGPVLVLTDYESFNIAPSYVFIDHMFLFSYSALHSSWFEPSELVSRVRPPKNFAHWQGIEYISLGLTKSTIRISVAFTMKS